LFFFLARFITDLPPSWTGFSTPPLPDPTPAFSLRTGPLISLASIQVTPSLSSFILTKILCFSDAAEGDGMVLDKMRAPPTSPF